MKPLELSKHEISILRDALKEWQAAPSKNGMMGSVLEAILTPKEHRQNPDFMKDAMKEANKECQQRENQAIMLMAKLIQYDNQQSEHDCEDKKV